MREVNGFYQRFEDPNVVVAPGFAPQRADVGDFGMHDEAVPNVNYEPALPALVRRGAVEPAVLRALGDSRAGQMWALKASHPNGEEVTASAGIPDHTNVPVITPEFRSNYTIVGESNVVGNDDVDIMVLSASELAFMYRRYTAGTNLAPYEQWRFVFYPAVAVSNDYINFTDSDDVARTASFYQTSLRDFGRTRAMYNGITVHLDAPTLADQGRLVAAQLPFETKEGQVTGAYLHVTDSQPGTSVRSLTPQQVFVFPEDFPYNESSLFQATPGAVVWEAREGVYMPMRFKEPVHLFEADRLETFFATKTSGGSTTVLQGVAEGVDTVTRMLTVGVPNNMLAGVILVRGIDKRANLNVKTRLGLESLVEGPTPVAPFQHASPVLDRTAIDTVTRLSQASPMAYPAEYNDFGAILGVIKNVLTNIVKPVSGALGGLGIPVVSDIAGGVNSVLGSLGLAPSRRRARRRMLTQMSAALGSRF